MRLVLAELLAQRAPARGQTSLASPKVRLKFSRWLGGRPVHQSEEPQCRILFRARVRRFFVAQLVDASAQVAASARAAPFAMLDVDDCDLADALGGMETT